MIIPLGKVGESLEDENLAVLPTSHGKLLIV